MSSRRAARPALACAPFFCALALVAACDDAPDAPAPLRVERAADLQADDRFAFLLGGCPRSEPFTAPTNDLLATTVSKLAQSEAVVASRARADLIGLGPSAVPELRRAFDRWFAEPGLAPRLLALLDLAAVAGGDEARNMGLAGLQHPSETVCTSAAGVLAATATPADFELLVTQISRGGLEFAKQIGVALIRSDPARAAAEFPTWAKKPEFTRVLAYIAPAIAASATPAVRAEVLADTNMPPDVRTWFRVASAASGDEQALQAVAATISDPHADGRALVLRAAIALGLPADVVDAAHDDPDPSIRRTALEAAVARPDSPEVRARIAAGLADVDERVREAALIALCARLDPVGIDRAIELLAGTNDELRAALSELHAPLARGAAQPGESALADRVLDRLLELTEGGARSTGLAIERAIGQVPLARAAEYLVTRGRAALGLVQDLPAHRWYAIQAGNTGTAGRAWIRAQWEVEPDPVRRLDLLAAGVQEKSAAVNAFLERVLTADGARIADAERLLAADYYARSVPIAAAAPFLKRASAALQDPDFRRAFDCLLWRFYGPERSL